MDISNIHQLDTNTNRTKQDIIADLKQYIAFNGFEITEEDLIKPWGAYIKLTRESTNKFIQMFFSDNQSQIEEVVGLELDPKFLLIEPNKKLSWQYHNKRSELWKILKGPVGVKLSDGDVIPTDVTKHTEKSLVEVATTKRHRLIGLENYGLVAEIWVHTNKTNPSNENDIIRVQDDFGRN